MSCYVLGKHSIRVTEFGRTCMLLMTLWNFLKMTYYSVQIDLWGPGWNQTSEVCLGEVHAGCLTGPGLWWARYLLTVEHPYIYNPESLLKWIYQAVRRVAPQDFFVDGDWGWWVHKGAAPGPVPASDSHAWLHANAPAHVGVHGPAPAYVPAWACAWVYAKAYTLIQPKV